MDPVTAGKLRAARRTALAAAQAKPVHARGMRMLLPTGALAAIALAALLAWSPLQNGSNDGMQPQAELTRALDASDELPPDPASADPSMYQNLDFYGWLAQNNSTSQANH